MGLRSKKRKKPQHQLPVTPFEEAFKIKVPQTDEEWAEAAKWKKIDANDVLSERGPEGVLEWLENCRTVCIHRSESPILSGIELLRDYQDLREPIIDQLLRRSEVMNIVAAPKTNKSWMALNIAMNTIMASKLFNSFACTPGRVLIIDNELHPDTLSYRLRVVAEAYGVLPERAAQLIDFLLIRDEDRLIDLDELESYIVDILPRTYAVVIMDAFYRFYPAKFDENSNAEMARLYHKVDKYASHLDSGMILIHHTSKGTQMGRAVTDVGAGAGTQTRACDTHLVLRHNEEENVTIVDAVARSFKPIASFAAKFKFPRWEIATGVDVEELKQKTTAKANGGGLPKDRAADDIAKCNKLLAAINKPMTQQQILELGETMYISKWGRNKLRGLITLWKQNGKIKELDPTQDHLDGAGRPSQTYIATAPTAQTDSFGNEGPPPSEEESYDPPQDYPMEDDGIPDDIKS